MSDTEQRLLRMIEQIKGECDRLAQRNAVLVAEIDAIRATLKDTKDRNVRLLSQLQEYEAREQ